MILKLENLENKAIPTDQFFICDLDPMDLASCQFSAQTTADSRFGGTHRHLGHGKLNLILACQKTRKFGDGREAPGEKIVFSREAREIFKGKTTTREARFHGLMTTS